MSASVTPLVAYVAVSVTASAGIMSAVTVAWQYVADRRATRAARVAAAIKRHPSSNGTAPARSHGHGTARTWSRMARTAEDTAARWDALGMADAAAEARARAAEYRRTARDAMAV